MPLWDRLPTWQRLTAIVTFLGGLVALLMSLPGLEPWMPATRSYARAVAADASAAVATTLSAKQAEALTAVSANTSGILDLKVINLDEAISSASTQLDMIELRLRDAPADPLLLRLKSDLETRMAALRVQRNVAACQRIQLATPGFRCP